MKLNEPVNKFEDILLHYAVYHKREPLINSCRKMAQSKKNKKKILKTDGLS